MQIMGSRKSIVLLLRALLDTGQGLRRLWRDYLGYRLVRKRSRENRFALFAVHIIEIHSQEHRYEKVHCRVLERSDGQSPQSA